MYYISTVDPRRHFELDAVDRQDVCRVSLRAAVRARASLYKTPESRAGASVMVLYRLLRIVDGAAVGWHTVLGPAAPQLITFR